MYELDILWGFNQYSEHEKVPNIYYCIKLILCLNSEFQKLCHDKSVGTHSWSNKF